MRKLILAAVAAAAIVACDDDDPAGPSDSIVGTYTLVTVDGMIVPATIFQDATTQVQVLSGSLQLNANNTWGAAINVRTTVQGIPTNETLADGGTYTRSGNTLTLTTGSSETLTATLGTNTVSADVEFQAGTDLTVVFQK